jgi:tRNA 2-thiouridine synthesizing protein A
MIEVDARGLSCPIPVVRTKEVIDKNPKDPLAVLVDNDVSKENVSRLAKNRGYSVEIEKVEDGFRLKLSPLAK